MRERRIVPTLTGGYIDNVEYISQRDAELRSKRSRRKCIVYRFISEETFKMLPEITDELLFRLPLHHLMLDIYSRKLNPFEILFNFERKDLEFMYKLFLEYGLLDVNNRITEKGKLVRKLSFGIRPSLLVLENGTFTSLVVASLIDKYFKTPFILTQGFDKKKKTFEYKLNYEEHIKLIFNRFRGDSDVETLYSVWKESTKFNESNKFDESNKHSDEPEESQTNKSKNLEDWCKENFIDYEYIKNVNWGIDKAKKILNLKEGPLNDEIIKKIYDDRKFILDLDKTILANYFDIKGIPYKPDVLSINKIEEKRPIEIYGIITSSIYNTELNSIVLSYVSPIVEKQNFIEKEQFIETYINY